MRRSTSPAGTRNISIEHTASARIAERCSCATAAVHLGAANACGLGIALQPRIALFCLNTWEISFGQLESLVSDSNALLHVQLGHLTKVQLETGV